jgi:dihydropyrimidine dehydrogenase (NAD+) subunit PreA
VGIYFLLGCGTVQVCTAAMLDHAVGPNVIKALLRGMTAFLERHADKGWSGLADFRGLRRGRVVAHAQIRRPDETAYHGGHDAEG